MRVFNMTFCRVVLVVVVFYRVLCYDCKLDIISVHFGGFAPPKMIILKVDDS